MNRDTYLQAGDSIEAIRERWAPYAPQVQKRMPGATPAQMMGRIAYRDIAYLLALLDLRRQGPGTEEQ